MQLFYFRLFFRIISRNLEVYALKIITLAIAFACTILLVLFSLNEFGYDRFHSRSNSVFRVIQRNLQGTESGNHLSNRIPPKVWAKLETCDSVIISRVKVMDEMVVQSGDQTQLNQKIHAADGSITTIFSFEIVAGSIDEFKSKTNTALLSSRSAESYFGTTDAIGKKIEASLLGDTVEFLVSAVFKDFPENSHEEFNVFIRFDDVSIRTLHFDPMDTGIYGKVVIGSQAYTRAAINKEFEKEGLQLIFQPLPDIYFGRRVTGEDVKHGDEYSIYILICINALILFLSVTSFINLTTLTLPHRSKELAIKKMAGTSQFNLLLAFAKESFLIVGISSLLGVLILLLASSWISPLLSIDLMALLFTRDIYLILIVVALLIVLGLAPLLMTFRFTRASPNRLLSTETITFPRFKRVITFLQLGVSLFLIVASIVIKRQINYSLVKEPGQNFDQVVYLHYPNDMTQESLGNLRVRMKTNNPNVVDVMATSQLPDQISSKEINSAFYIMGVDPAFKDFFDLQMIRGNWFKANDGDSIMVVNERALELLGGNTKNVIGVFKDMSGQFNQGEKPVKINIPQYLNYNFLCIRILEVDIRKTVHSLSEQFGTGSKPATVRFLNKRFEEWLHYQDRLNTVSEILAIISALLSCCAIYGLSVSLVRDKLKQIAIHKMFGAKTSHITVMLVKEFAVQMLMAVLFFGPLTYIVINELLRTFVYHTHFSWLDPFAPLLYCGAIITLLCGIQALSLNRSDLTASLK